MSEQEQFVASDTGFETLFADDLNRVAEILYLECDVGCDCYDCVCDCDRGCDARG